jgi:hypothetical protein
VEIGRSDVDAAGAELLVVLGVRSRQLSGALEDLREDAGTAGGCMNDDEDTGGEIAGEAAHQFL